LQRLQKRILPKDVKKKKKKTYFGSTTKLVCRSIKSTKFLEEHVAFIFRFEE
jgi:hypothetical protein